MVENTNVLHKTEEASEQGVKIMLSATQSDDRQKFDL